MPFGALKRYVVDRVAAVGGSTVGMKTMPFGALKQQLGSGIVGNLNFVKG